MGFWMMVEIGKHTKRTTSSEGSGGKWGKKKKKIHLEKIIIANESANMNAERRMTLQNGSCMS